MSPEDILDGARSIRRDLSTIVSSVPIDVEGLVQMSECEWIDLSALLREHCKDGRLQPGNPFTMVLNESEYPDYNRLKRELAWLRAR